MPAVTPNVPCGPTPSGFVASDRFVLGAVEFVLVVEIVAYHGPGLYSAPPERVSVHKARIDNTPLLLTGTSGSLVVSPGATSGTVDEDLLGDAGTAHLLGRWSC